MVTLISAFVGRIIGWLNYATLTRWLAVAREEDTTESGIKKLSRAKDLEPTVITIGDAWKMDVHSHAHALEASLEQRMQQEVGLQKQTKRKTHLSDETWQYILQKRAARRKLAEVKEHGRLTIMRVVFENWKGGKQDALEQREGYGAIFKSLDVLAAQALHDFRQCGRLVTACVRKDDNRFYQEMARKAGQCDPKEGRHKLWRQIRAVLPKNKMRRDNENPLWMVSLDDQWHAYFNQLEQDKPLNQLNLPTTAGPDKPKPWGC